MDVNDDAGYLMHCGTFVLIEQEQLRCRSFANKKSPATEYGAGQKNGQLRSTKAAR